MTRHLPFDWAQGRESFDIAQDPEVLEGPVERSLVTFIWRLVSERF